MPAIAIIGAQWGDEGKGKATDVLGSRVDYVVKFNGGIMGKNWVHLRDGSGSAADNSNDILVTSMDEAKVGDVVIAKGIVKTDVNLGAGYAYKVLVEDVAFQK